MKYVVTIAAPLVGVISNQVNTVLGSYRVRNESSFPAPLVRLNQVKVPVGSFLAWQEKHGSFIGALLEEEPLGVVTLAAVPRVVELFDRQHWGFEVSAPKHVVTLAENMRLQFLTSEQVSTAPPVLTILQAGDCYASNTNRAALHQDCTMRLAGAEVQLGKVGVYLHRTDQCMGSYVTSRPYAFPADFIPFRAVPLDVAAPPFSVIEDKLAVRA